MLNVKLDKYSVNELLTIRTELIRQIARFDEKSLMEMYLTYGNTLKLVNRTLKERGVEVN